MKPSGKIKFRAITKFVVCMMCCASWLLFAAAVLGQGWTPHLQLSRISAAGFPVFLVSLVPGTNSPPAQVRVYLQWSEDMKVWQTMTPREDNCVAPGMPLQMVSDTNIRTAGHRFYRVLAYPGCPF